MHFAGIHFGTELHVPLLQIVDRLVVGWNCARHWTDTEMMVVAYGGPTGPVHHKAMGYVRNHTGSCNITILKIDMAVGDILTIAPGDRMTPPSIRLAYCPV